MSRAPFHSLACRHQANASTIIVKMNLTMKETMKARFYFLAFLVCSRCWAAPAAGVHHYVFFNHDRERIAEAAFLQSKFDGAQLKYTWRQLEHPKDQYDFGDIEHDLAFLQSKGKKLFIQIQDASFDLNIRPFPPLFARRPNLPRGGGQTIRRQ